MYKHFFEKRITRYNGQWYCFLCNTELKKLTKAQSHSEDAHPTVSTQTSDFPNKSITLTNKGYKMLLNHSIVIRDAQRDYFCIHCKCSISSLNNIYQHMKKKSHQKYMDAISKQSTNKKQNSNNNANNEQSNISVDNSAEQTNINESNLSAEIRPISRHKLIKDDPKDSTRTTNETIANVTRHLQEAHPNISDISDFLKKSIESYIIDQALLNHEKAVQNKPKGYFCAFCQCSIPSLDHFNEHLNGRKHKHMRKSNEKDISTNIVPENPANKQNVNNDTIDNDQNIDNNKNDSIRNVPSNFKTKEKSLVPFPSYNKNSISDDVLQIEECVDMAFCCLCDIFIHKTNVKSHVKDIHDSIVRKLKIVNQQATCTIELQEEGKIIRELQLNSKKFDGTTWPEYTETVAKYTCDQCNKKVEKDDIINHEITIHKSDMMSSMNYISNWELTKSSVIRDFNIAIYYPLFKCSFCNEIIHGISSLSFHFSKRKHEENIKLLADIKRQEFDNCKDIQVYLEPLEFISIIFFENSDGTLQIKEQSVIYIKNHRTTFKNSIEKKFTYVCFACQHNVDRTYDVIDHLCKTSKHLKHFKNIFLTYNHIHNISISNEHNTDETREIKSLVSKDVSIDNESFEKHDLDHNHNAAANISNKNEKNNSGLFISLDIFREIENTIKYVNVRHTDQSDQVCTKLNEECSLNHYNKMYNRDFLDFEEIMFVCNETKLREVKLNLQFFLPQSDKMRCLLCKNLHSYNAQAIYEHMNCETHFMEFVKLHENKEHYELLRELIQPTHREYTECFACSKFIHGTRQSATNSVDYKYHIYSPSHQSARKKLLSQAECILEEFQNLWYSIQYFACAECGKRFKLKITFLEHLNTVHKEVLRNKDNSMFDFCLFCATLWYKKESCAQDIRMNYRLHCYRETHIYLQERKDFAITPLPKSIKRLLKNVDGIAANLFDLSNDTLNDRKVIQLTDALKHIFETRRLPVEVCMFGSRVTGLALPNSDIDIYLNFGDECTKPESIKSRSKQIQDCLRADHGNWDIELTLTRSRTPIIKVKHRLTGLQCDISFMNGLSVENSKLIKSFNTACPPCQKLILFLKKWLLLGSLNGPDEITNYALVWLVIFYLQVKFKAPSIDALIKSHNQSKIVSGWETGVGDTISIGIPKLPIHELLLGFFKYYGSFDYMRFVVCPLLGETCQKTAFTEASTLPNSMGLYVTQLNNEKPEYFRIDSSMCVQDPFDLSHNLTKAVPILTLRRFKHYCKESLSVLHNVIASSSKKKI